MEWVSHTSVDPKQSSKMLALGGLASGAILLLLACHESSPTAPPRSVPRGAWGGAQVALTVVEIGGTLQQPCASGTIMQPMLLDASGRFDVAGTYIRRVGGPSSDRETHPAAYIGSTDGRTMTITVRQTDDNQTFGPLTLTLGQQTRIEPCPLR